MDAHKAEIDTLTDQALAHIALYRAGELAGSSGGIGVWLLLKHRIGTPRASDRRRLMSCINLGFPTDRTDDDYLAVAREVVSRVASRTGHDWEYIVLERKDRTVSARGWEKASIPPKHGVEPGAYHALPDAGTGGPC